MQNICKNIDTVAEDLETLDSIIYEDDEDRGNVVNDDLQVDCEVREMKHQLFEVRFSSFLKPPFMKPQKLQTTMNIMYFSASQISLVGDF